MQIVGQSRGPAATRECRQVEKVDLGGRSILELPSGRFAWWLERKCQARITAQYRYPNGWEILSARSAATEHVEQRG